MKNKSRRAAANAIEIARGSASVADGEVRARATLARLHGVISSRFYILHHLRRREGGCKVVPAAEGVIVLGVALVVRLTQVVEGT